MSKKLESPNDYRELITDRIFLFLSVISTSQHSRNFDPFGNLGGCGSFCSWRKDKWQP